MWRRLLFVFCLLLGLGAFFAIPFIIGIERVLNAFASLGIACILLYALNAALTTAIPAISWYILMRAEGLPVRLHHTLTASFMAWPVTVFTPSMYVGGEPVKAMYISKRYDVQARRVWATIIVGKFQEIASLILMMILSVIYIAWRTELVTGRNEIILIITVGLLTILFVSILWMYTTDVKPLVKVIHFMVRMGFPKRRIARLRSKIEHMEQIIHDSLTKRWRSFLLSQSIVIFSAVSLFIRPLIFFLFMPTLPAQWFAVLCGLFVACNLVNVFSLTPGSLGLFEGGVLAVFAVANLGAEDAAAFGILNRISDITLLVFGIWLLMHFGVMTVARGKVKMAPETVRIQMENPLKPDDTQQPKAVEPNPDSGQKQA